MTANHEEDELHSIISVVCPKQYNIFAHKAIMEPRLWDTEKPANNGKL